MIAGLAKRLNQRFFANKTTGHLFQSSLFFSRRTFGTAMTASVRILTGFSVDTSPSILFISPDGSKILVNCGEGCQRAFLEHSQRLSSVTTVLLTHLESGAIGGLPGAILSMADATAETHAAYDESNRNRKTNTGQGNPNESSPQQQLRQPPTQQPPQLPGIDVMGPHGTRSYVQALRHFMIRSRFPVRVHEGQFERKRAALKSQSTSKRKRGSDYPDDRLGFRIQSLAISSLSPTIPDVASYILTTPPVPGKFLIENAQKLGIPRGPLYKKLKQGQAVTFTNSDGVEKTVQSSEVVEPDFKGCAVFVLYYPTADVAEKLLASEILKQLRQSAEFTIELVVHMTTFELFQQNCSFWENGQGNNSIDHVLFASDDFDSKGETTFRSAAKGAKARSLLHEELFLIPSKDKCQNSSNQSLDINEIKDSHQVLQYRSGDPLLDYTLIPLSKRGFTTLPAPEVSTDEEALKLIEESGAMDSCKEILSGYRLASASNASANAAQLLFTGTGSAVPCKHRNVTGMLLQQADGRSMLLDAGEGTLGQLLRMGEALGNKDDLLSNVKAAWISHPHADHHLGLVRILQERKSPDPLLVVAPQPILRFLHELSATQRQLRTTYEPIDCRDAVQRNLYAQQRINEVMGITQLTSVPVTHCQHSYAVVLDGTSFGRVAYSGDCRPSTKLVQAARGADVLIHEATFEDGMKAEAVLKKHSTIGEALHIAQAMEAKTIVLTHFSQRYPKVPPLPAEHKFDGLTVFAFDYMRLRPNTLELASKLTPALRVLHSLEQEGQLEQELEASQAAAEMSEPGTFARSELL